MYIGYALFEASSNIVLKPLHKVSLHPHGPIHDFSGFLVVHLTLRGLQAFGIARITIIASLGGYRWIFIVINVPAPISHVAANVSLKEGLTTVATSIYPATAGFLSTKERE